MTTNIANMHLAVAKASAFSSHEVSKSSIADVSSGAKGASCAKLKRLWGRNFFSITLDIFQNWLNP